MAKVAARLCFAVGLAPRTESGFSVFRQRGWKTSWPAPPRRWLSVKHARPGGTSLRSLQSLLHRSTLSLALGARRYSFLIPKPSCRLTLPCPPPCSPSPAHRTTTVTPDLLPPLSDSPGHPKTLGTVAAHTDCRVPEGPGYTQGQGCDQSWPAGVEFKSVFAFAGPGRAVS